MKKLSVSQLKAGMVVAEAIVTKRGQVIAKKGTTLTSQLIARLSFYKITTVFVTEDSLTEAPEKAASAEEIPPVEETTEEPVISQETTAVKEDIRATQVHKTQSYTNKLYATPKYQIFQTEYSKNIFALKKCFYSIIKENSMTPCDDLLAEARHLFSIKTSLEIFDMIHTMRSLDDSIYAHCLNVALISRAIGMWLHLSKEDLDTLTSAGLLHDIGKIKIPDQILNKKGRLTEEEYAIVKQHAKNGYSLLKELPIDSRIKYAALQHHERFDGSGYPRGLDGDEIDFFASIVAIADVYDAMTAARSYRAPICPFEVIAAFEKEGFQKYNTNVIFTFLKRVAGCYNNSRVLLSNGVSGRIAFINKSQLSRPVIELDSGEILDLSSKEHKELFVKSIL